jgi:hypothetical protein
MRKNQIRILVPLLVIAGFLVYTWARILLDQISPFVQHYVALILFIVLVYLFVKHFKWAVIGTGLFLLLGTFNLLTLTLSIITKSYGVGYDTFVIMSPGFQPLSAGIFILYAILNFDQLTELYLDYKEAKEKKYKG